MKNYILVLAIVFYSTTTSAQSERQKAIEQVISENIEYILKEDLELTLTTIHTQSPNYKSTAQIMQQLFATYDLKYEILDIDFIGVDEEYAYARVLQKSEKISGPQFSNNELDALQVFKREDGQWKLWSQANLTINYLTD